MREYNAQERGLQNTIKETWNVICSYMESHASLSPSTQGKYITHIASLCAMNTTYTESFVRCALASDLRRIIQKILNIPAFETGVSLNTFKIWSRSAERGVSLFNPVFVLFSFLSLLFLSFPLSFSLVLSFPSQLFLFIVFFFWFSLSLPYLSN